MPPSPLPVSDISIDAEIPPFREAIALAVAIEVAAIAGEGTARLATRLRQNAGYELAEDGPFTRAENQRGALLRAIADQLDALT